MPRGSPAETCLWVVVDGDPPSEDDVATVGSVLGGSQGVSLGDGPGCVSARIAVQSLHRMGHATPGFLAVVAFNVPGDELSPYIVNLWGRERPEVLARAARALVEEARARLRR
jgi:hypothetical protein